MKPEGEITDGSGMAGCTARWSETVLQSWVGLGVVCVWHLHFSWLIAHRLGYQKYAGDLNTSLPG